MHSLSIGKKDYAQILVTHLSNWRPTANATVFLDLLLYRMIDDPLNPLILNKSAVRPNTHCLKVLSGFHYGVLGEQSTRAIFGNQNGAVGMLSSFKTASDFLGPAEAFLHQLISSVVGDSVASDPVQVVELLSHFIIQLELVGSARLE